MPSDVRITLSVVILGIIVLGVIFIPKAMKYRKRLSETSKPKETEQDKTDDIVVMIVEEKDNGSQGDSDSNNKE